MIGRGCFTLSFATSRHGSSTRIRMSTASRMYSIRCPGTTDLAGTTRGLSTAAQDHIPTWASRILCICHCLPSNLLCPARSRKPPRIREGHVAYVCGSRKRTCVFISLTRSAFHPASYTPLAFGSILNITNSSSPQNIYEVSVHNICR